jgi:hypothetical protein
MQRLDTVSDFIGRAIGHKVRTNLPNLRRLYGLDQS